MKTIAEITKIVSGFAIPGLLIFLTIATADAKTPRLEEEKKLSSEIMMLNNDAKIRDGDRIAADKLMQEFKVPNERITALRDKNFDYGEIAVVLGMADKLSGGVNDANINKVLDLRKTAAGWAQVAANLNVDLGDVANKVSKVEDDVHRELKTAATQGYESGRGAGGTATTSEERPVGTQGADY